MIDIFRYWQPPNPRGLKGDPQTIRRLVIDAVKASTVADVPVACFLSGGLDSTLVYNLSGCQSAFTGYYDEPGFSELGWARIVTTNLTAIEVTPADFEREFHLIVRALGEPIGGPGVIGQWFVAKAVAEAGFKVVLSGQGGDELFGGYGRHMILAGETPPGYEHYQFPPGYPQNLAEALRHDAFGGHLEMLLAVEDRICMAHGLESRPPLMDHHLWEHVLQLDPRERVGKRLLKEAMRGLVPDAIIDRTDKMGFPVPVVKWANGPLRDFVGDRIGYIPPLDAPFARRWWAHLMLAVWAEEHGIDLDLRAAQAA